MNILASLMLIFFCKAKQGLSRKPVKTDNLGNPSLGCDHSALRNCIASQQLLFRQPLAAVMLHIFKVIEISMLHRTGQVLRTKPNKGSGKAELPFILVRQLPQIQNRADLLPARDNTSHFVPSSSWNKKGSKPLLFKYSGSVHGPAISSAESK